MTFVPYNYYWKIEDWQYQMLADFFDEGTPDTYWEDNSPTPEYYIACEFEITK